ncbi:MULTISPECIES: serine hydrolase domain-containing protein [Streptomyces]|jgi:CubicO group peptidase (beta-lactamase class C family)|uniref:CubicO group peptidase (Beta-lactamase class C family) n=1 Tax=Streptomyces nymphaeiformis TaxID=2663842 RepID=A0A7W7XCW5_9ACTN|nr:serine hydrolase domain-containing protein [Streptomyces nymphaeiformis]MBB4982816.1 CubicO group peptidase (beta-lactamase class C family) [Streptomyces nymphaeiformis]
MSDVHGTVEPGFESVREVFAEIAADEARDGGAQLAVHHHGRLVVDLWGGDGVDGDSLLALYSSSKGAAALVAALLVQEGVLDLDREVASWWPEFAAEGKEGITLRQLLSHRAGLIGADGGLSMEEASDDRLIAARLAGQRPFWEPGTGHGYHAVVFGSLVGEVVLRATGRTVHELFEERVRAPYALDYYLGLPEELEPRFRTALPMRPTPAQQAFLAENPLKPDSLTAIAFNAHAEPPFDLVAYGNSRTVHAKSPLSGGGVGTARGLSRMYAAVAGELDGRAPLLAPDTLAEFARIHSRGTDLVTGSENAFGLGFVPLATRHPSLGPGAIGHSGAPGSQAFADPATGLAYSYARRRFGFMSGPGAPENDRLIPAVVEAAAGL